MRLRQFFPLAVALLVASPVLANVPPEVLAHSAIPTLTAGGATHDVDLRSVFRDPDVPGSAVRINIRIGATTKPVFLALFDQQKPITVANFLQYISSGRTANNFFHRSVPGFVVQGGGFRWTDTGVEAVPTFPTIQNEPGISNLRGTVAMAKLGDNPNSATSQWFVNLADNSANLDFQNGGFTVFARVIGAGMAVIDEVAALPRYNAGGAFDNLPAANVSGEILRENTVETNSAVVPALTYSVSSGDSSLISATLTGSTLTLTPAADRSGQTTVTVIAIDLEGATTETSLPVQVVNPNAPVLTSPAPQTLQTNELGTAVVPDWRGTLVTVSDPGGITSFTQSPAPGSVIPVGSYALTFRAVNSGGKSASVQTILTVSFASVSAPGVTASAGAQTGAGVPTNGGAELPAGISVASVGTPAISNLRQIAARVTFKNGKKRLQAVYREDGAGERVIVAHQAQAAGVIGGTFKSFRDPVIAPSGAVAFAAKLVGISPTEDDGVWSDLFGSLAPILREGHDVPGVAGLKVKSILNISMSDAALLATVKLMPGIGVVKDVSDLALIRISGASTGVVLVRTGVPFEGSSVKAIAVLQAGQLSPGQGRWHGASQALARLTLADKRVVVVRIEANGSMANLVQAGVEDSRLGTQLSKLGMPAFGGLGVALLATESAGADVTKTNDSVLLTAPNGAQFGEVVRENDLANLEDGSRFASFADPVMNDRGNMLFHATLRGPGVNEKNLKGLWKVEAGAEPEVIARQGDAAVDGNGAPQSDTIWASFISYALPDGASAGALFVAKVKGKAVTDSNSIGVWAVDSTGTLRQLLRTGDNATLATGNKQIARLTLLNATAGSIGARRSYNATGSVAVHAIFTDNSQAVLRLDVP
jgi:cyclophilin family peptidyl-prolyl cis-trans isomerase